MSSSRYILHRPKTAQSFGVDYSKQLNASQLEVVKEGDGYCLVLAGAGSGKTRTLIYRVLYLIESGVPPQNILLVTFTNKAAHEMRQRVEKAMGGRLEGLWCGTFHHIGLRILRMYSKFLNYTDNFQVLDEEDSLELIKTAFGTLNIRAKELNFPKPQVVHKIISLSSNLQEDLGSILDTRFAYFNHFESEIRNIAKEYVRKKREINGLDFDDLLTEWIRFMQESEEVRTRLTQQFQYILVDEFQDTNALQNKVVELLSTHHKNLLVVGDDAQSIYSFRGAQIDNILNFPKAYPDVRTFRLDLNYRSTPQILQLANASIAHNIHQFPKALKSVRNDHIQPQLVRVRDVKDQSLFVAQRIQELVAEGVSLKDMAVLFRARFHAADLEMELTQRKMPYVLRGGVRFFEQAHIKDVLAYLKIAINAKDEIAWNRILTLYPGIGAQTARKLFDEYATVMQMEGNRHDNFARHFGANASARIKEGVQSFKATMNSLLKHTMEERPDLLILDVIQTGYAKILESRFDNAQDRLEDLNELANFAHTHDRTDAFLNDLALRENFKGETVADAADASVQEVEHLVLSTIHQAKGLEWRVVFILNLAEGQFPHYQASDSQKALEEERRLFYVASTRAKDELVMVHPMTRFDREAGTVIARTSPFIQELPETMYDQVEAVDEPNAHWDPMLDDDDDILDVDRR